MDASGIRDNMQVLGSDGGIVGAAIGTRGSDLRLRSTAPAAAAATHLIPLAWVTRVDDHVHLDRDVALVRQTWTAAPAAVPAAAGAAASRQDKGLGALWWAVLGLLLLGFILAGVWSCSSVREEPRVAELPAPGAVPAAEGDRLRTALAREVRTYLDTPDAPRRTFTFNDLNFETSSAQIRLDNRDEIAELATVLRAHPQARIRILGFADARGDAGANRDLGLNRARAVADALGARGIAAERVEVATGGEATPQASNATERGRFENRRTELEILSR